MHDATADSYDINHGRYRGDVVRQAALAVCCPYCRSLNVRTGLNYKTMLFRIRDKAFR